MAAPDLGAIEAVLRANLEDASSWAVYADALAEAGESARADAVVAALRHGPTTPAQLPPAPLEADVWYGHWRGLHAPQGLVGGALLRALDAPWATFVEHVSLADDAPQGFLWAELPPSVTSAAVRGTAPSDLGRLQALSAEALADGPVRGAHLTRLRLGRLGLATAQDADLPVLAELTLRLGLDPDGLRALLATPLVRGLRRLDVAGAGLAEVALGAPHAWAHLESLTIDDPEALPHTRGRMVVRTATDDVFPELGEPGTVWMRLAPPATPMTLERAVVRGLAALNLSGQWDWGEPSAACGVALAPELARTLGAWIARHHRCAVQVAGDVVGTFGPDGVLRPDTSAWEYTLFPDAEFRGGAAETLQWGHLEEEVGVSVVDHPDHDEPNDYDSGEEGYDDDDAGQYHGATLSDVWVPPSWPPDPFELVDLPAVQPRRLTVGDRALAWEDGFGGYLWWRGWQGRSVRAVPAPDLSRWTARLLVRHRLAAAPDDPDHPYWADWRRTTASDRGQRGGAFLAAYKLEQPGPWLLDEVEARLLAEALRVSVADHTAPERWSAQVDAAKALLREVRGGITAELLVR